VREGPVYEGHQLGLPLNYEEQSPDPDITPTPPLTDAELGAPLLPNQSTPLPGNIVPGSRRPAAPKIAYAVPTMRWETPAGGSALRVIRHGNGLRVYLERPWFSSGEGELLGVVVGSTKVADQPFANLPPELVGYVSQWGQDPILDSTLPRSVMHAGAFGARVATYEFELPEAGRSMVVAAHRVHYDFDRRLWYADLEIDSGASYNPFVRLALVRVQPYSVGGCALSEVVHTQYAQLMPTREIQLRLSRTAASLQVYGPAPKFGPASARGELTGRLGAPTALADAFGPLLGYGRGYNRIEMVVQEQSSNLDTDLDWEDLSGAAALSGDAIPGQTAPLVFDASQLAHDHAEAQRASGPGATGLVTRMQSELFEAGLQNLHLLRNDLLFSGRMALPAAAQGKRRRLIVREYERHFGDFNVTDQTTIGKVTRPGVAERLVFARELYVLGYVPSGEEAPAVPTP